MRSAQGVFGRLEIKASLRLSERLQSIEGLAVPLASQGVLNLLFEVDYVEVVQGRTIRNSVFLYAMASQLVVLEAFCLRDDFLRIQALGIADRTLLALEVVNCLEFLVYDSVVKLRQLGHGPFAVRRFVPIEKVGSALWSNGIYVSR